MPNVMANWYRATIFPRIADGETSEIYMGETIEATPTPTPPISLYKTSSLKELQSAQPKAEIKKKKADKIKILFLPNRSDNSPANNTPITHPTKAELTNHPSCTASNLNCSCTKDMVPEITAVSNPNKKPPIAAEKAIKYKYDFDF